MPQTFDIIDTSAGTMAQLEAARDDVADKALRNDIAERAVRKGIRSTVAFLRDEVKSLVELADAAEAMKR